jgi:hypothetical protein
MGEGRLMAWGCEGCALLASWQVVAEVYTDVFASFIPGFFCAHARPRASSLRWQKIVDWFCLTFCLYSYRAGAPEGFFSQLVDTVVDNMGAAFPELVKSRESIKEIIKDEVSPNRALLASRLRVMCHREGISASFESWPRTR